MIGDRNLQQKWRLGNGDKGVEKKCVPFEDLRGPKPSHMGSVSGLMMLMLTVVAFSRWIKSAEEAKVEMKEKKQYTQGLSRLKAVVEGKIGSERGDNGEGLAGGR